MNRFSKVVSQGPSNFSENIDESVANLTNTILKAASESIPVTSQRESPFPGGRTILKTLSKNGGRHSRIFKNSPIVSNLIEFKKRRAKVRYLIKIGRRTTWESFVQSININTPIKDVFNKINKISGVSKFQNNPIIIINDRQYSSPSEIATCIAKAFQTHSLSDNYTSKFKLKQSKINIQYQLNENPNICYNDNFNMTDFDSCILKCNGSSPGPDNINYEMLKNLPLSTKNELLYIYNTIWDTGKFPNNWKKALVVPILKPQGNPTSPDSFRPISLTSCMCKLFERMVNRKLMWYLISGSYLNILQTAYIFTRSATDHHITLENEVLNAFLKCHHTGAVFFDIKKAYDRVCYKSVLKTLYTWGIRGKMLTFIKNFVSDRSIQVIIGNPLSNSYKLENGIPQGSVFSVTLFLCAINSILDTVDLPVKGLLYADDLTIFVSHKNIRQIEKKLQLAINKLSRWSDGNGLAFSEQKTKCMLFTWTYKDYAVKIIFKSNTDRNRGQLQISRSSF